MENPSISPNNWCTRVPGTPDYIVTEDQHRAGELMPAGHTFNLSVPRFLHWVQSPHDPRLLRMAAWHDLWLNQGMDRTVAAAKARLIAREDGVEAWYTHVLFWAMTLWTAYD